MDKSSAPTAQKSGGKNKKKQQKKNEDGRQRSAGKRHAQRVAYYGSDQMPVNIRRRRLAHVLRASGLKAARAYAKEERNEGLGLEAVLKKLLVKRRAKKAALKPIAVQPPARRPLRPPHFRNQWPNDPDFALEQTLTRVLKTNVRVVRVGAGTLLFQVADVQPNVAWSKLRAAAVRATTAKRQKKAAKRAKEWADLREAKAKGVVVIPRQKQKLTTGLPRIPKPAPELRRPRTSIPAGQFTAAWKKGRSRVAATA